MARSKTMAKTAAKPATRTKPVPVRQGPPPWTAVGRHAMLPEAAHDEIARFNFLANLNAHLSGQVLPGIRTAYEARVKPALERDLGRAPKSRHEVRKGLVKDPYWQTWSALRRSTMEMRQQAGRALVLRQIDSLIEKAKKLNKGKATLTLNPDLKLPRYVAAVDHHIMPGSYHTELKADDVSAAANYDAGLFVTTGGALGLYSDGGGVAVAEWIKANAPDFKPKRILDAGCGLGHNVLPIAQAFPKAEIIAIDVSAPMLRYGHARAQALGITNVHFIQANIEDADFADESFDWIQTTMFLHETSHKAMPVLMKNIYRMLKPGGLMAHVEQPQYDDAKMDVFEQAMRDWDAFYNNEPYWTKMHEVDLDAAMEAAGFDRRDCFVSPVFAVVDERIFPKPDTKAEDYGRTPAWDLHGAWKGKTKINARA